jgi:3-isopropylmalate dehydrogenase
VTTVAATREIVDVAFRLAAARRGRLTLCHKTNILVHAGRLWEEIVDEVGADFPDVERDYVHADAMCQHLPLDPGRFDVVVTDNLFGDIISDLGATVQGGLGLAASANFNPLGTAPSMFEPVHGSAPDIAGKGWANPAAAVLSASVLAEMPALAGPDMGGSTDEIGARIAERVATVDPATIGGPGTSLVGALATLAPVRTG